MSLFSRSVTQDMIALLIALLAGAALIGQPGRPGMILSGDVPQIGVVTSMATGHAPAELLAGRGA
jgi:hypothetical protein